MNMTELEATQRQLDEEIATLLSREKVLHAELKEVRGRLDQLLSATEELTVLRPLLRRQEAH